MSYQDVIEHFICGRALHAGNDYCIVVETAYPATGSIRTLLYKNHLYAERVAQVTTITLLPNTPAREIARRLNYLTGKLGVAEKLFGYRETYSGRYGAHLPTYFDGRGVATVQKKIQLVIPDGLTTPDEIIAYNMMTGAQQ